MAHVQIKKKEGDSRISVVVDGTEMGMMVSVDGFGVGFPSSGPPEVSMVVVAGALEIDIPDAVVKAISESSK